MPRIALLLVVVLALGAVNALNTTAPASRTKNGIAWADWNSANIGSFSNGRPSWFYTWSPWALNNNEGFQFIPMMWGAQSLNDWNKAKDSGVWSGSDAVLGFNEPDRGDQSNMSPQDAARNYASWITPVKGKGLRLGAPAVSSASSGANWFATFWPLCQNCQIDFIPLHWYGANANNFKNYVQTWHQRYGRPIWITEWACVPYDGPCDPASVSNFMRETQAWLESTSYVERYAWFGAIKNLPSNMENDRTLNANGQGRTGLGNQYWSN